MEENNKKSKGLIVVFILLLILWAYLLYSGTIHRFSYLEQYKDYSKAVGVVESFERYENTDSDRGTYYTYSACIEYVINGKKYTNNTGDIFKKSNIPEVGKKYMLLYNNKNPKDSIVAKYDSLIKSYVPMGDNGDINLIFSFVLLGFVLIFLCVFIKNENIRLILFSCGFIVIGLVFTVCGIIVHNFVMLVGLPFVAVGVYFIFRAVKNIILFG